MTKNMAATVKKISAKEMVLMLRKSGVPMHYIKIAQDLTEAERAEIEAQVAA